MAASWPATKRLEQRPVLAERVGAVLGGQRAVDVARVALQLVELGDEGDGHLLLRGDLLRAVLVDGVVVAHPQRLAVVEVDLVLAEVALALGVLDPHPGAGHLVADAADQRLDPRGAQQRVVDVVEVGRVEVAVAGLPGVLVGVLEQHELQLGARHRRSSPRSASRSSWRRRIWRGLATTGSPPCHCRSAMTSTVAGCHGIGAQRVEVGHHLEVAVAALPRRHLVAVDGLHVHVHGQQVVAALGAVLEHVVHEVRGGQALALQPALHVGDGQEHGVHRPSLRPPSSARRRSRARG